VTARDAASAWLQTPRDHRRACPPPTTGPHAAPRPRGNRRRASTEAPVPPYLRDRWWRRVRGNGCRVTTNQRHPPQRRVRPRRQGRAAEDAARRPTSDGQPARRPLTACRPAAPGTASDRPATPPSRNDFTASGWRFTRQWTLPDNRPKSTPPRARHPAVTTACDFTAHSPPTASPPAVPSPRGNNRGPTTFQPASNQRRDRPRRKDPRRKDPAAVTANQRPSDQLPARRQRRHRLQFRVSARHKLCRPR